ncbi:SH3 domain-containing protein [Pacificibacter marinus]|uniref:Bacterial SH3 domain protein n=1 Tax=Pacificibacter marinus TaxID=658057 RepID=A0A1Y5S525_9RHOB|nr:SH3 domain-containing protein [Pacificibacter marinus]SEK89174.1 SH3 domain-containing protein [Pacificibacter marinus]SLN32506.1 Bacterial SH3 domain protein [Pacificibacter marinus]
MSMYGEISMLRLSALTLAGLIIAFLIYGGELSPAEKAELDALRAQRTSIVAMVSDSFSDTSKRPSTYVPTLAHLDLKPVQAPKTGLVQLASYTPAQATPQLVATTTVANPAKLAALVDTQEKARKSKNMVLRSVTATRVNVRSGPSTSNSVLGQVIRADIVRVVSDPSDAWVKIVVEGDGIEGYMSSRFLTRVPE